MDGGNNKWLIILQGLPGSGKSTFAEKINSSLNFQILSKDPLRINDSGDYVFQQEKESEIEAIFSDMVFSNLDNLHNIIIDNLNLSSKKHISIYQAAKQKGYKIILVRFNINDIALLAERNQHNVSIGEIKKMVNFLDNQFDNDYLITINADAEQDKKASQLMKIISEIGAKRYKRTNHESDLVVNEIVELITNGYSRQQIIQYCADSHGVGERQTDNYLSKAYDVISTESQKLRSKLIKQSFKRYNELYYKNIAIQDYRECRGVQDSITRLFGLNMPTQIDHTTAGESINKVNVTIKTKDVKKP